MFPMESVGEKITKKLFSEHHRTKKEAYKRHDHWDGGVSLCNNMRTDRPAECTNEFAQGHDAIYLRFCRVPDAKVNSVLDKFLEDLRAIIQVYSSCDDGYWDCGQWQFYATQDSNWILRQYSRPRPGVH